MKTDKRIQRQYNFSVTVNVQKELVFACNKCAETWEPKYFTWLEKNWKLTNEIKELLAWCSHSPLIVCKGTCWEWDFPSFCSLNMWMIGLIWLNDALQHRFLSLQSWMASLYEGDTVVWLAGQNEEQCPPKAFTHNLLTA